MIATMGRKRSKNFTLPPRMHEKSGCYYYVTTGKPRKWIKLDSDLPRAKLMWAQLEQTGSTNRFSDMLDGWIASPEYSALAALTKKTYENIANRLREFFDGGTMEDIKPLHIAQWLDNNKSKVQANTGKAIISKVFDYAIRKGFAETNPAREIKRLSVTGRDRYLTDDEFMAIRSHGNDVVKIAMDVAYLTGARIGDILKIKIADCQDNGLHITQQKTGKKQIFTMTPELAGVIADAKKLPRPVRGLHLLCTRRGAPYLYGTFNEYWIKAREDAKVEDVHFHDIRAKAATDAKRLGMDYQSLLGHTSKAMSDRYIKPREIDKVEPLRKKL